jgi:hypothetical protein
VRNGTHPSSRPVCKRDLYALTRLAEDQKEDAMHTCGSLCNYLSARACVCVCVCVCVPSLTLMTSCTNACRDTDTTGLRSVAEGERQGCE